ncbi:hypothetical protein DFA_06530 [Cavenderia fasciculata]|uniref:IPT/TIG domain-containing protein n=1 Tax=Cavenderia fasciculata TaxID=261658 RepID=F4PJ94_CACFS|nr:uncharacterized protein DFA_06530 [Cavenderia fasciculata]EGG24380.1 hypothetical protein DFA_06530 [Cavenderia fasciculata]|eukprot:XP_004362231.1 hypothetical protein DFA_06530 [Cavenderia fasciculata]
MNLSPSNVDQLEVAFSRWCQFSTTSNQLVTKLLESSNDGNQDVFKFLNHLSTNYDQETSRLDLCLSSMTVYKICKPMTLVYITQLLATIMSHPITTMTTFGDLSLYKYNHPIDQGQQHQQQLVIIGYNNLICDYLLLSTGQQLDTLISIANKQVCKEAGPILIDVKSEIPTSGGQITITALYFSPETINVLIGDSNTFTATFQQQIDPVTFIYYLPQGSGRNIPITLDLDDDFANNYETIKKKQFFIHYSFPSISVVIQSYDNNIESSSTSTLTIQGANFGSTPNNVQVTIDSDTRCNIETIVDTSLTCQTLTSMVSGHHDIIVTVNGIPTTSTHTHLTLERYTLDETIIGLSLYSLDSPQQQILEKGSWDDRYGVKGIGFSSLQESMIQVFVGDQQCTVESRDERNIIFRISPQVGPNQNTPVTTNFANKQTKLVEYNFNQFSHASAIGYIEYNLMTANSTHGGSMVIFGDHWGFQTNLVQVTINQIPITCKPFGVFVECIIPPGLNDTSNNNNNNNNNNNIQAKVNSIQAIFLNKFKYNDQ